MSGRLIAIGDIHGYNAALKALLEAIQPTSDDTIITLGDYVDRGPDVPGAIETLLQLKESTTLVPIQGNHDEILLAIYDGNRKLFADWLNFGGNMTLACYQCAVPNQIPPAHIAFLREGIPLHETATHFFTHASYVPNRPLDKQPTKTLAWGSIREKVPKPHVSGKIAVLGHTAQRDGEILDLPHLKCIDTHIYGGGWLTAMEIATAQLWQADAEGKLRQRNEER